MQPPSESSWFWNSSVYTPLLTSATPFLSQSKGLIRALVGELIATGRDPTGLGAAPCGTLPYLSTPPPTTNDGANWCNTCTHAHTNTPTDPPPSTNTGRHNRSSVPKLRITYRMWTRCRKMSSNQRFHTKEETWSFLCVHLIGNEQFIKTSNTDISITFKNNSTAAHRMKV